MNQKIVDFSYEPENIPRYMMPMGVVWGSNGCCQDQPIIITVNVCSDNTLNYSCQCGCGGWCTNGHRSEAEALREYEDMTERKVRFLKNNKMYSEAQSIEKYRYKVSIKK